MAATTSEVNISVSQPRVISQSRGHHWFPTVLHRFNDGGILLMFSLSPDQAGFPGDLAEGEPHALLKSFDEGANWLLAGTASGDIYTYYPQFQLNDGTLLGLSGVYLKCSGEPYLLEMRSSDGVRPLGETRQVPVRLPEGVLERQEESVSVPGTRRYMFPQGGPIQLANGDLLMQMCTKFKGDKLWRLCLSRYTEASGCWSYVTTIGDPNGRYRTNFSESDMICLPDGSLLSVIRTAGSCPMFQAKSTDDGQTWKLQGMTACGVKPKLRLLTNGVVACSSGRLPPRHPGLGDQILFSVDGAETWTEPTRIFHGPSTGYTSMLEISPNELLYVYDDQSFGSPGNRLNQIMAVNIKVERK